MPIYIYSAAKKTGEIVKGEGEAADEKTLGAALKNEGLLLVDAKEKGASRGLKALNFRIDVNELTARLRPVGLVDKMFFARNLSVMVEAGLSLNRALDALSQQSKNPKFRKIIDDVNQSVARGNTFAQSLKAHQDVFGELFVNMVDVGETTGKLSQILKLLANQMKKDNALRKRVRGAMIYPAIIITVLVIVGTLMMIYVVPTLSQTIEELGVAIPVSTQIIIFLSKFIASYIVWILLGLAVLAALLWRWLKTEPGKKVFDKISLRFPVFGSLIHKYNSARFCRTLAYLISAGVPIVRSLEIAATVLGNIFYRKASLAASRDIQKGQPLNQILAEYPNLFEPLVIQMVQVGEETGKMSDMLLRVALFFEEEVTNTTKNLSSVIEPILMVVVGIAVGFFAISMLQPIYSSLGNI